MKADIIFALGEGEDGRIIVGETGMHDELLSKKGTHASPGKTISEGDGNLQDSGGNG